MCDASLIPNEYTACECYRGYTIALRNGFYDVFTPTGARIVGCTSATRADARKQIDKEMKRCPISLA